MKSLQKESMVRIGFVNKTSGFNGHISCVTDVSNPDKLLKLKFFFLILEGLPVPFAIEEIELKGDVIIVKFEDVDSELEAKKLLRKEIYVEKLSGRKKTDVISWKDFVNYTAIDNEYGEIGIITEVLEFPKQMIAKCLVNGKEVLFPLNDDIVTEIDEKEKKVFVELPGGLLDVYLA